jgi:hypothetical protein
MADNLVLQRYTKADRPGVFALLREAFSAQYAKHLLRVWSWKYDSHPLNREAQEVRSRDRERLWSYITQTYPAEIRARWGLSLDELNRVPTDAPFVLLLKDGDEVVATEGSLPRAFLINGERHLASIGCDFAVHPRFRGRQLSMRLALRTMAEHRMSVGWYNGSSWASTSKWEKSAAHTLGKVTRLNPPISGKMWAIALVKPIDWLYTIERASGIQLPARVKAWTSARSHRGRGMRIKSIAMTGVEVFDLEAFDSRFDDLWQRCARDHQVIGVRDRDFLTWRFTSRPDTSYLCLAAARGSQILGYLVYRIVERDAGRLGYIVDFLIEGEPDSVFALLVARAEEMMVRAGVQSIICPNAKATFRKVLHQVGFYSAILGVRTYLSAEVNVPDERTSIFADLPKWFLTVADGDAEMSF